jgi:hypothetical protein
MENLFLLSEFQKDLEKSLNKSVKLRINDNRSTMLSVKWEPDCTRVSMHRFFLDAPKNIMDELACYIRKEHPQLTPSVKSFIENQVNGLDYSHEVRKERLSAQGRYYDLERLMGEVNRNYFQSCLDLNITWFKHKRRRIRSQFTFGLYHQPLKLVKINSLLDTPEVPEYILSYVIYHEMLHHVYPSYCDIKGKRKIHHQEFKEMEKQFSEYDRARSWIEHNRERLIRMR